MLRKKTEKLRASELLARAKSLRDGKAVRGDSPSYLIRTNRIPLAEGKIWELQ